MDVLLTWTEVQRVVVVGTMRQIAALRRDAKPAHALDPGRAHASWGISIEGAAGEMAFAKACDVYADLQVHARPPFPVTDVAGCEVKTTPHEGGRLFVHDSTPDGLPCVLVVGRCPSFRVAGFTMSQVAKVKRWRAEPVAGRPCYAVPQSELRPIQELDLPFLFEGSEGGGVPISIDRANELAQELFAKLEADGKVNRW